MKRQTWDQDYLDLADFWAQRRSKDPSTQVGAVIVREDKTIVSVGFNGFPRGVDDHAGRYNDRPTKYAFVCHAEPNAILTAGERLHGCTIYVSPLHPCGECAKLIIQSGMKRVVTRPTPSDRWQESFDVAKTMFEEAGVTVDAIEAPPPPTPVKLECQHRTIIRSAHYLGYECCDCGLKIEDGIGQAAMHRFR